MEEEEKEIGIKERWKLDGDDLRNEAITSELSQWVNGRITVSALKKIILADRKKGWYLSS